MNGSNSNAEGEVAAAGPDDNRRAGVRRWLAMLYETLPLFAIAFLATLPVVRWLPEHHVEAGNGWYRGYLLVVWAVYFGLSWSRGGQTLGMRPWRLYVVATDGRPIGFGRALLRYAIAVLGWLPLGAGHWWYRFDAQGRNWHDRVCATRVERRDD